MSGPDINTVMASTSSGQYFMLFSKKLQQIVDGDRESLQLDSWEDYNNVFIPGPVSVIIVLAFGLLIWLIRIVFIKFINYWSDTDSSQWQNFDSDEIQTDYIQMTQSESSDSNRSNNNSTRNTGPGLRGPGNKRSSQSRNLTPTPSTFKNQLRNSNSNSINQNLRFREAETTGGGNFFGFNLPTCLSGGRGKSQQQTKSQSQTKKSKNQINNSNSERSGSRSQTRSQQNKQTQNIVTDNDSDSITDIVESTLCRLERCLTMAENRQPMINTGDKRDDTNKLVDMTHLGRWSEELDNLEIGERSGLRERRRELLRRIERVEERILRGGSGCGRNSVNGSVNGNYGKNQNLKSSNLTKTGMSSMKNTPNKKKIQKKN